MQKAISHLSLPFSIILILSVSLIACDDEGESDGSSSGPAEPADFTTSAADVEAESTLSGLSEDQATALCEAQRSYFQSQVSEDQAKRAACALGAAFAASFGGEEGPSCDEIYNTCLAAPAESTEGEGDSCNADRLVGCDATVSQLEACAEEQVNFLREMSSFTCSDLNDPSAAAGMEPDAASACAELAMVCPELSDM